MLHENFEATIKKLGGGKAEPNTNNFQTHGYRLPEQ